MGSTPCTPTTGDRETVISDLGNSILGSDWNDRVSAVSDYNHCDVQLWWDINFRGSNTGFINNGSGMRFVGAVWNDEARSVVVS